MVSCRHRATRLCIEAAQSLMKACGGDLQFEGPGWNSCTVDMIRVAKAHSMLVLQQTFSDAVDKLQRAVSPQAFRQCLPSQFWDVCWACAELTKCCVWPNWTLLAGCTAVYSMPSGKTKLADMSKPHFGALCGVLLRSSLFDCH